MKYRKRLIEFDSIYGRVKFYAHIPINKKGDDVIDVSKLDVLKKERDKLKKFIKPTADKISSLENQINEIEDEKDNEKYRNKYLGKFFKVIRKKDKYENYIKIIDVDNDRWNNLIGIKIVFNGDNTYIQICEIDTYECRRKSDETEFNEAMIRALGIIEKKMLG